LPGLQTQGSPEQVGHAQWVFTIPKMLRIYFLHHRELLGALSRAAYETVKELMVAAFYSVTVRGFKFQKKAGCVYQGHRALYLGPYASVMDEEGHLFPRGQAIAVCTDTLAKLSREPYAGAFVLLEPGADVPEAYAVACRPGCC